jgi:hypothetical protein
MGYELAYHDIYYSGGEEYGSAALSPVGYTIYVPHASVVEVTFSGTIIVPAKVLGAADVYSSAGFQLGIYNTLTGPVSEFRVPHSPRASLNDVAPNEGEPNHMIAVSTTYRWKLCAGTYVVNVYIITAVFASLGAWGQLSIGINRQ